MRFAGRSGVVLALLGLVLGGCPPKAPVVFEGEVDPNDFVMRRGESREVRITFADEAPSDLSLSVLHDGAGGSPPPGTIPTGAFACASADGARVCQVTIETNGQTALTKWKLTLATPMAARSTAATATVFFTVSGDDVDAGADGGVTVRVLPFRPDELVLSPGGGATGTLSVSPGDDPRQLRLVPLDNPSLEVTGAYGAQYFGDVRFDFQASAAARPGTGSFVLRSESATQVLVSTTFRITVRGDAGVGDGGESDAGSPDGGTGGGIILTFTASPMTGDAGIPVTFAWTTDQADQCALAPSSFSVLGANDSVTFAVAATTTFTLTCSRQAAQEQRTLTVTLTPPPVSITSFEVAPSPLSLGDEASVSWTVAAATACTLMPGSVDAGLPSGVLAVVPASSTTFTLTCAGQGGPVSASASVVVIPNNPPVAAILAPDAGATFEMGDDVTLAGTCTDDLAGGPDLWPSWSTVPGQAWLGSALTVTTRALATPGSHTVQLQCMDALGKVDPTPPQVSLSLVAPRVASASVAYLHMCLLTGSGKLFCAGDNRQGLLGQGATSTVAVPRPARVGSRADWVQVATGYSSTIARAADGTLWTWGQGAPTPSQVGAATDWTHVSTSGSHQCGLRAGGELWCWGSNFKSQLGVSGGSSATPMRVGTATNWTWVATAIDATCGLRADSTVWCWGRPLGSATTAAGSITPVQVGAGTTWATLSLGGDFACGLDTAGALYCWGSDSAGQLGDGASGASSLAPARVGAASDWVEISTGSSHACGRRSDGSLWCWGSDASGQLGNGTAGPTATPTRVGTAADWVSVSAGGASGTSTCGVRDGGQGHCWGLDDWGQLGIGLFQASVQEPAAISFAP